MPVLTPQLIRGLEDQIIEGFLKPEIFGATQSETFPPSTYHIRQNIRGGKLSRFSWILAKRKCFTIETFPASQLENNYCSQ